MVSAIRAEGATYEPGQLPVPLTPLLGRVRELAALRELLLEDGVRVVTLLGPGGVGKTRLAIEVAAEIAAGEEEPPVFVAASHLRRGDELLAEIARVLGVRERPGVTVAAALAEAIGGDPFILLLDNLEQIPDAGHALTPLLGGCPGLLVLATSRVPLRIAGERRFPVSPLPVDGPVGEAAAVALFVARVRAIKSEFDLTAESREVATAICRRLDGLPLAIELAAARCSVLSPAALLARLTNHLGVLRGERADLPERQQTLNAVVAWSYELLPEPARRAFRRLSAIPDGFTLPIAEWVMGDGSWGMEDGSSGSVLLSSPTPSPQPPAPDVLDAIALLVEHSLLERRDDGGSEPRFRMLQTIRDAGRILAAEQGELDEARDRLAACMLAQAELVRAGLGGAEAVAWRRRCADEHALLIAAIERLIERNDKRGAVALAGALWRFWYAAGSLNEGRGLLERALALPGEADTAALANAVTGLGALLLSLSELDQAVAAFERAAVAYAAVGDAVGRASAANNLALVFVEQGRYADAIVAYERSLALLEELGESSRLALTQDNFGLLLSTTGDDARAAELHARALASHRIAANEAGVASAAHHLAIALNALGDLDGAEQRAEEARAIWAARDDHRELPFVLNTLGNIAASRGDIELAIARQTDALCRWREQNRPDGISLALFNLGNKEIERGNLTTAHDYLRESLDLRVRRGDPDDIAYTIGGFAGLALATGDAARAAKLAAGASALRDVAGLPPSRDDPRPELRRALGKARFAAAWKAGQALDLAAMLIEIEMILVPDTAAAVAKEPVVAKPVFVAAPADHHGLTERELDVVRQIAAGKSNAEIGEALFISPFTAKTHVANVLGKLGVESRAAASVWAAQHGLLAP